MFYGFKIGKDVLETDKNKVDNSTGTDPNSWDTFAQCFSKYRSLGCRLMLTNAPVFSTYTQGDITFNIRSNGSMGTEIQKKPGSEAQGDAKTKIMQAYLKDTKLGEIVTDLYFTNWQGLVHAFIGWGDVIKNMPWLSHLDLSGCTVDQGVANVIRDNQQITKITVRHHQMPRQPVDAAVSNSNSPFEAIRRLFGERSILIKQ